MKKKIALLTILAFIAGFATNRILVQAEVKEIEDRVTAAVGKLWGYDDAEAKEFVGILGEQYTPEELTQLMHEMVSIGKKMEDLYFDERLVSTLRALAYLETLEKEGAEPTKEKMITFVRTFYEDHRDILNEEPSNEMEETLIGALKRIKSRLQDLDENFEPADRGNG